MHNIAHIKKENNGSIAIQKGSGHSFGAAEIAKSVLEPIGLGDAAYAAALKHDMGKFKKEFEDYLHESFNGNSPRKGSVIHTFASVRYDLDKYHAGEMDKRAVAAEISAYGSGAHHGLFDIEGSGKENGFDHRLHAGDIFYEESVKNFHEECVQEDRLDAISEKGLDELEEPISVMLDSLATSYEEWSFYTGLLARLILSAVIEGDRTDTASFETGREWKRPSGINWKELLENTEEKILSLPNETEIDKARSAISAICRAAAERPGGIYRLNVPTGSGKTLSSLRYALAHADKYDKQRIVFVIPLLAVIDQNAADIREYIGDDSIVLESHSNVVTENRSRMRNEQYQLMDSWNSPVIITTLVQFLNAVFKDKTSCIRRFHALTNSVIIIDEVQNVPIDKLSLFNLAVNFLSRIGRSTVILCSATQSDQADKKTSHPLLTEKEEIVPYDPRLWKAFKRTEIIDAGSCTMKDAPTVVEKLISGKESALIVCNKKAEAAFLYKAFKDNGIKCFHYSASMCLFHRKRVLSQIRKRLNSASPEDPVICISTQAIEAGVNISFGTVVRLLAGLDNAVQSDGRNNRNAEHEGLSKTYLLRIIDENLNMLTDIRRGKNAAVELLYEYQNDPDRFDNSLAGQKAIDRYYSIYYRDLSVNATCGPIKELNCTLFDLLADNKKYSRPDSKYCLKQAFKTAGELFNVIEDDGIDAITPYGRGKEIIRCLKDDASLTFEQKRKLIEEAKDYTVRVYPYQQEILERNGDLTWVYDNSIAVLSDRAYDNEVGLVVNKSMDFLGV